IIPCRPSRPVFGARGNAQIIEREIMLFIQANRGLGSILFSVKQPEKLPVIFPIPAGVAYVHESFLLDLARNVAERWKSVGRRRTFWPKLFFLWKPEGANARENFERARFLCIRILKSAQADAEHDHAECKEDAKKH